MLKAVWSRLPIELINRIKVIVERKKLDRSYSIQLFIREAIEEKLEELDKLKSRELKEK